MSVTDSVPDLARRVADALGPQYQLEGELGRGGMGIVFRARDTSLDRPVAVKVIHPDLVGHEGLARRFLDEARTIARLRHPNIVTVYSAGSSGDLLWYVMDEVPGETLRARLDREGALPPADVARITADLASALDAASAAGVVHRDVKPDNILLEEGTGRPLLADFGIARAMEANRTDPRTALGVAIGTPTYMSPEQAAGDEVDARSDLYSLGVVAYEMLTGKPPFQGPQRMVVSQHLSQRPAPIRKSRPEVSPVVADAIMRALEKNPSERWQTGEEFGKAILGESTSRPWAAAGRHRRRGRRLAIATAAVLLLGVGAVALFGHRDGPPAGVNPRLSMIVLPFNNLRNTTALDWLREGSVSMLALNLSQWNDLKVVDNERLHDLLDRHDIEPGADVGLAMARRLAREAGVWTIVMGEYEQVGDSLHLTARVYDVATGQRIEQAQVSATPGEDVRPVFDDLAARLLDLSGAPSDAHKELWAATTSSLEAYRAYLQGSAALNNWDLASAERSLKRATDMDSTFGLAYYKYALTRGWLVGAEDSLSNVAMARAVAHSENLPQRQRTIIAAYAAFIGGRYGEARNLYEQLIARDTTDADAWYGLGEAWYHDMDATEGMATTMTRSLRAFNRTLALDPDYALAYEHIEQMLTGASREGSSIALMPGDSFAVAWGPARQPALDSATRAAALRRAQGAVVTMARNWVTTQPSTYRAHSALVDAYIAAGDYRSALTELERFNALGGAHPELRFVEARIRFASGDVDRAAALLTQALDSVTPEDFSTFESTPNVLGDVAAAANVFAYRGEIGSATRAIEFADRVRRAVYPGLDGSAGGGDEWRRSALAQLYGGLGAPDAALRQIWHATAEDARMAPPDRRGAILKAGAPAAVGLFTGLVVDTSALTELSALSGGQPLAPELQAWMAISRRDTAAARKIMQARDTSTGNGSWVRDARPLAATVYAELGDEQAALDLLSSFQPAQLATRGFDSRWAVLGRVRLLRAALEARLGHTEAARQEYQLVLAQWKNADPGIQEYVRMAQLGLAGLEQG
jgi:serine/threonine-protein kinase